MGYTAVKEKGGPQRGEAFPPDRHDARVDDLRTREVLLFISKGCIVRAHLPVLTLPAASWIVPIRAAGS